MWGSCTGRVQNSVNSLRCGVTQLLHHAGWFHLSLATRILKKSNDMLVAACAAAAGSRHHLYVCNRTTFTKLTGTADLGFCDSEAVTDDWISRFLFE